MKGTLVHQNRRNGRVCVTGCFRRIRTSIMRYRRFQCGGCPDATKGTSTKAPVLPPSATGAVIVPVSSKAPVPNPTSDPVLAPTMAPLTFTPSTTPLESPSTEPSQPKDFPPASPTGTPSIMPSSHPTAFPSSIPTNQPSVACIDVNYIVSETLVEGRIYNITTNCPTTRVVLVTLEAAPESPRPGAGVLMKVDTGDWKNILSKNPMTEDRHQIELTVSFNTSLAFQTFSCFHVVCGKGDVTFSLVVVSNPQ